MKKAKLLWMDLEMTGLDPTHDRILEVACVLTGWDLKPIVTYTAVVKVADGVIAERMQGEFWKKNAKARDGLIKQNVEGKAAEEVEEEIVELVDKYFGRDIYLAGNSIHQDRKFIDREWPKLAKRLHYRMLDVSAWKVYFAGARKDKFMKPESHRALDDILGSIEEMKYYREKLK